MMHLAEHGKTIRDYIESQNLDLAFIMYADTLDITHCEFAGTSSDYTLVQRWLHFKFEKQVRTHYHPHRHWVMIEPEHRVLIDEGDEETSYAWMRHRPTKEHLP